jgi:hypothetical protein
MVAILNHRQHHIIAGQPVHQGECMLPWHVRILCALQDANRAPHIDGAAEQQMVPAVFD